MVLYIDVSYDTSRVKELELIHDGLKAKSLRISRYYNSGILHFDKVLYVNSIIYVYTIWQVAS